MSASGQDVLIVDRGFDRRRGVTKIVDLDMQHNIAKYARSHHVAIAVDRLWSTAGRVAYNEA